MESQWQTHYIALTAHPQNKKGRILFLCISLMYKMFPPSSPNALSSRQAQLIVVMYCVEISFRFSLRSHPRRGCRRFHLTSPLHAGAGGPSFLFPFTSVLSYCHWSPHRHTNLIRLQSLRMVVKAYRKHSKNHRALRSWVNQLKDMQIFNLLVNTWLLPSFYFCLSLTVSLRFTFCNCALQFWSKAQPPPPHTHTHTHQN